MSPAEKVRADLKVRLTEEVERLAREYDTTPAAILAYAQSVLRGEKAKPVSDRMSLKGEA